MNDISGAHHAWNVFVMAEKLLITTFKYYNQIYFEQTWVEIVQYCILFGCTTCDDREIINQIIIPETIKFRVIIFRSFIVDFPLNICWSQIYFEHWSVYHCHLLISWLNSCSVRSLFIFSVTGSFHFSFKKLIIFVYLIIIKFTCVHTEVFHFLNNSTADRRVILIVKFYASIITHTPLSFIWSSGTFVALSMNGFVYSENRWIKSCTNHNLI